MVLMLKVAQGKAERGGQRGGRWLYLQTPLIGRMDVLIIGVQFEGALGPLLSYL